MNKLWRAVPMWTDSWGKRWVAPLANPRWVWRRPWVIAHLKQPGLLIARYLPLLKIGGSQLARAVSELHSVQIWSFYGIAKILFCASHPNISPIRRKSSRRSWMNQHFFEIDAYAKWQILLGNEQEKRDLFSIENWASIPQWKGKLWKFENFEILAGLRTCAR